MEVNKNNLDEAIEEVSSEKESTRGILRIDLETLEETKECIEKVAIAALSDKEDLEDRRSELEEKKICHSLRTNIEIIEDELDSLSQRCATALQIVSANIKSAGGTVEE